MQYIANHITQGMVNRLTEKKKKHVVAAKTDDLISPKRPCVMSHFVITVILCNT